jgi:hypothetical protein
MDNKRNRLQGTQNTKYAILFFGYAKVFENVGIASTGFWLRENAGHGKIFAASFRFTIGTWACSGSVEKLQIGAGTGG